MGITNCWNLWVQITSPLPSSSNFFSSIETLLTLLKLLLPILTLCTSLPISALFNLLPILTLFTLLPKSTQLSSQHKRQFKSTPSKTSAATSQAPTTAASYLQQYARPPSQVTTFLLFHNPLLQGRLISQLVHGRSKIVF